MVAINSLKSAYTNADGLTTYFGKNEGTVVRGGEEDHDGRHATKVVLDLTTMAVYSTTDELVVAENVSIPAGAMIEEVWLRVLKETAGSTANLDLGLVKKSDRATEIDFNGLITAGDDVNGGTDLGALYKYIKGTTDAGALVGGAPLTYSGLITASAETADWTAGIIEITVFWSIPLAADL